MRVYSNLLMRKAALVLSDDENFPIDPVIGQFCFTEGILYIYATLKEISTWYPLTNKSLYYVHTQGLASLSWTVEHNLASVDLIIMVYDQNNIVQLATDLEFTDENTLTIGFIEETRGRAIIFAATDEYGLSGKNKRSAFTPITATNGLQTNVWEEFYVNTSSAPMNLLLPESRELGDQLRFIDVARTFDTNNLTLIRADNELIDGLDEDLICDITGSVLHLFWSADPTIGWVVTISTRFV